MQFSFGYRWQHSDRHFTGASEDLNRNREHSQVVNDIHILDFALTYGITERISGTVSLPVLIMNRTQPIRNGAGTIIDHNETNGNGIGDMSLVFQGWILKPSTHTDQNVAISTGAKFPTGNDDLRDVFKRANGTRFEQAVDQSIQPGDGGFGWILGIQAFKQVNLGTEAVKVPITLYGQGTYLFNPRNTNGTLTGRGRASEAEMSVPDAYLARLGFAVPIPVFETRPFAFTLGGRIEGVPPKDAIGDSDGLRRPGYAVSIEPGLVYSWRKNIFAVSFPVALYRDRQRSVPDIRDNAHGDAAFADFLVLFSFAHRFGGPQPPAEAKPEAATAAAIFQNGDPLQ
jgi:hypothetical protein